MFSPFNQLDDNILIYRMSTCPVINAPVYVDIRLNNYEVLIYALCLIFNEIGPLDCEMLRLTLMVEMLS